MASAVSFGSTVRLGLTGRNRRRGRRLHRLAEHHARFLQKLFAAQSRLGDDLDRAVFERLQRALRAFFGQARTDDHRDRVLGHDLLQEGQAVHAGHFDIQGDDIRHLFGDALGRDEGIAGGADDFNFRIADRTSLRVWRTSAESSTIRTRIFAFAHRLNPAVSSGALPVVRIGRAGWSSTSPVPVWK